VTFGEDASRVRTGTGPHDMTCLGNLVIGTSAAPGRSTSPPHYAATAATLPDLLATLGISLG
jgi:hypothetical protein